MGKVLSEGKECNSLIVLQSVNKKAYKKKIGMQTQWLLDGYYFAFVKIVWEAGEFQLNGFQKRCHDYQ